MEYAVGADVNAPPIFVRHLGIHLRFGSFVHVALDGQPDDGTSSIAMMHSQHGYAIKFVLFPPVFPKDGVRHPSHPKIPPNNLLPIATQEMGSDNVELYASQQWDFVVAGEKHILQPAFVFTLEEFQQPENCWAHGIRNVFIVRFTETYHQPRQLIAVNRDVRISFPDQFKIRIFDDDSLCQMVCFNYTSFKGLHTIQRYITRILNKRSGSTEDRRQEGISGHPIPHEPWSYIKILAKKNKITVHRINKIKESYLDISPDFTRRVIQVEGSADLIRFETQGELQLLREILGFGATYGSVAIRPTLRDGVAGKSLQQSHRITVIYGKENDNPFRRQSRNQRVDLLRSDTKFRIVVSYEKYGYEVRADGTLLFEPPTEHLSRILHGHNPDQDEEDDEFIIHGPFGQSPNIVEGSMFENQDSVYKIFSINTLYRTTQCTLVGGRLFRELQARKKDPSAKRYGFRVTAQSDRWIEAYYS